MSLKDEVKENKEIGGRMTQYIANRINDTLPK